MNRLLLNKFTKTNLTLFYDKEQNSFETYLNVDEDVLGRGFGHGEKS